jgi:hypothetical protein
MHGLTGFEEVQPPLREAGLPCDDWFECRSRLALANENEPAGLREPSTALRLWREDDCPKFPGSRYARFFRELDGWTEYWDIYHPETHGLYYFGDAEHAGYLSSFMPSPVRMRNPVFDAWKILALCSGDEPDPGLRERFETEARRPQVVDAVLAVDELVLRLVREHFGISSGEVDALAFLDAMERFGKDTLPECPERFAAIPDDDPRKSSSLYHTIEGHVMWFGWAVHLECAELVAPRDPAAQALRRLLLAGAGLGCSFDFAFRGRCRTRREYVAADAKAWASIWSRARRGALSFSEASDEARILFRIREYGDTV